MAIDFWVGSIMVDIAMQFEQIVEIGFGKLVSTGTGGEQDIWIFSLSRINL